jgi:cytochrome c-type biogenesis protein CcmH/NrfG
MAVRGLAGALALAAATACGGHPTQEPAPASRADGGFLNQAPGVAYVGGATCRPCHAETWSTFSHTGMGRSSYPLTADRVIEDWTTRNTFEVKATGLRYRMFRRDGKFFMRQSLVDTTGRESAVDERELIRVIGSGHHSRTYLVAIGDKLFQAPMCWYTKDAVWDLCPGYEENNDYFSRQIDRTCVFCHNARMELQPGARNAYALPIPNGIDCERCHGPGKLHVDRWVRGETPTGEGDPAIVNPTRLTATLRMQICFQCHLGDSKSTERVARVELALEDWRPGRPIAAAMVPFRFSETTPHDYGLSAQVDRLLLSRCYLESEGRLECVTCHNPHVTVYRKDRPQDFFTAKCLGCHAKEACPAPASARRATVPPDDCVLCHMRKGEPSDHRHADFTDHWIRRRIDEPRRPRSSVAVVPYLPDAFDALSPADRAFYTGRAISLRAHAVPPEVQRAMWPEAEGAFREAIRLGFTGSEAWFFLGKALSALGKHRDAAEFYAAAYAKDKSGHDAAFAYGQSLLRQKRTAEAERIFDAMILEHPESAAPLAELARCRGEQDDFKGALDLFRKALEREPWNSSLHENAAMMLSALERHDEAMAEAEQAIRFDPQGRRARQTYATLAARAAGTR